MTMTEVMGRILDGATVSATFDGAEQLAMQLKQVARLISARNQTEAEREVFVVKLGGFDTHTDEEGQLSDLLTIVNGALTSFVTEMQTQGVWDSVTIAQISDFGRTIPSNGLGTDHGAHALHPHSAPAVVDLCLSLARWLIDRDAVLVCAAWGGNSFVLGGAVRGGRILGQWPDLAPGGELDTGRGRLIPTTPWDGMWHGIAEWMGVEPAKMQWVLPNLHNFDRGTTLITRQQLFTN
eukprot:SAG25_NODE_60_length_18113_cov_233.489952_11_plen_237_part_00